MPNQDWIGRQEARAARHAENAARFAAEAQAAVEAERAKRAEFRIHKKATLGSMSELTKLQRSGDPRKKAIAMPNFQLLPDAQTALIADALLRAEKFDWSVHARPDQLWPIGAVTWVLLGGRGSGKTRTAVEKVREVCETPGMVVAMVAANHKSLRDVCLEGRSGLIACCPPETIKKIHKGLGDVKVEFTNGSVAIGYTAMEPDAVRGMSFDMIWGDEFAAWPKNRAEDMIKQLRLCMRESKIGSICILSTTPKRIPHVLKLVKAAEDPEERIVITRSKSRDNKALSEEWHRQMERDLGGTRLGRQELDGELVMDAEKALWSGREIDECRWTGVDTTEKTKDGKIHVVSTDMELPKFAGVITGVDPSGSKDGDATGIVTIGWTKDNQLWVIENKTRGGFPGERYRAACMSAFENGAGEIWYESAYGGDNVAYAIEESWKNMVREGIISEDKKMPAIKKSTVTGDKSKRAGPVAQLYEQQMNRPDIRRIWHAEPTQANGIASLEDEMLTWETDSKKSPNAIDALVHAVRAAMRRLGMDPASISSPASKHSTRRINKGYNPYGNR